MINTYILAYMGVTAARTLKENPIHIYTHTHTQHTDTHTHTYTFVLHGVSVVE